MPRINKNKFFQDVSSKCNYLDPEICSQVYYGLIKAMMADIRKRGEIYLPGLGRFSVTEYKATNIKNVNTGRVEPRAATKVLRFDACDELKYYIRNMRT